MENYVQESKPPFLEIFTPLFQGKPPFNPEIFQTPLFEILAWISNPPSERRGCPLWKSIIYLSLLLL